MIFGASRALAPVALAMALVRPTPAHAANPPIALPAAAPFDERKTGDAFLIAIERRLDAPEFARIVGDGTRRAPSVGEAVATVLEAEGVRAEVRAAKRPRVDLDLTGQKAIDRAFSNDPNNILERSRPDRRADAQLTAEQLLFDFGAGTRRLRAARARADAARAGVALAAEGAAIAIVGAWYDVWVAETDLALAVALVGRNLAILADKRTRIAGGLGARADITRVETYLASAQARAERARQARETARLRFRTAAGEDAPPGVTPPVAPVAERGGFADAVEAAHDNPAVTVAENRLLAARRDLDALRADRYPRLTAGLDAAKYSVTDPVIDHDIRGRLTLRYQLSGGGLSRARVAEAGARAASQDFVRARTRDEAERDAGIAFLDVESLTRQTAILREAYIAARRTRDAYAEQFRVARGSLLEMLRAEVDLEDAAAAYARGLAERDLARYTLLARTGRLLDQLGIDVSTDTLPTVAP